MRHQAACITVLTALLTGSLHAATPTGKDSFSATKTNSLIIVKSTYEPVKLRDPFGNQVAGVTITSTTKTAPVFAGVFQLQGILGSGADLSATINGKLVTLNKPITINAGGTEVQVNAIEIGRDRVVLEVGGQKVELRLKTGTETGNQPERKE